MKKRKGFTLIELLAVIVILAVIALIATPLIMNTINDARDSAMLRSIQNIQHSAEQHLMAKKVLYDDYEFSMNDFDYKGEKYKTMNIAFNNIDEAGVSVYKNNKCYYILAGSSNAIVDKSLDEMTCLSMAGEVNVNSFREGDIVFLNPENGEECNPEDAVSTTGTTTGCMRWYVMNVNKDGTLDLLLDHNVMGALINMEDLENEELMQEILSSSSFVEYGENLLEETTTAWKYKPRLIDKEYILNRLSFFDDYETITLEAYEKYGAEVEARMNQLSVDPNVPELESQEIPTENDLKKIADYFDTYHSDVYLPSYVWLDTYIKTIEEMQNSGNPFNASELGILTSAYISSTTIEDEQKIIPWVIIPVFGMGGVNMPEMYGMESIDELRELTIASGIRPVITVDKAGLTVPEREEELEKPEVEIVLTGTKIGDITNTLLTNAGSNTYTYMGGTYLKGEPTNNYVWYNGMRWRIMGKNQDGSIRMITDNTMSFLPWGASNSGLDYSTSYVKDWLNNYFYLRLEDRDDVVNSYFCEDTSAITDVNTARTTCSNPVAAKVGLISLDEYNLMGGPKRYVDQTIMQLAAINYTMTPSSASKVWVISNHAASNDNEFYASEHNLIEAYWVRPVISVSPDTIVTGGTGVFTAGDTTEYILNQTLDNVTGTLKTKSSHGEYVEFDGKVYRIYSKSPSGVKLLLEDFYSDSNGEEIALYYGQNDSFETMFVDMEEALTSNELINWLAPNLASKIIDTNWIRGNLFSDGNSYINIFSDRSNVFTNKVGLPRLGELMFGMWGWSLTPTQNGSAYAAYASLWGAVVKLNAEGTGIPIHPTIQISSDTKITSGNGTLANPYKLSFN